MRRNLKLFSAVLASSAFVVKMRPTRDEMLTNLKTEEFDVLIIGGGATGSGIALDAAARGLKVALVEKEDFGSGTSSKSTKLVHGGVRYLEKAIMNLDIGELKLVTEALNERKTFVDIAPHISNHVPILLPMYKLWEVPYYYVGCKLYDLFSGKTNLASSYFVTAKRASESFPLLKTDGLWGGMVYFDGQHNDSRMNLSLALTAIKHGASVVNYCSVVSLKDDKIMCRDEVTHKEFEVKAKYIVNSTGPWSDDIRGMKNQSKILETSKGIHIVVPGYFAPTKLGLIDPNTSDGRVIFFLPWLNHVVIGTTDTKWKQHLDPLKPNEGEVEFLLKEVNHLLNINITKSDVKSVWSGIRPLVNPSDSKETKSISRSHYIQMKDNLLTISGGKWTTYRKMSQDVVDILVGKFDKKLSPCDTHRIKMIGGDGWRSTLDIELARKYQNVDFNTIHHLVGTYGDSAEDFLKINSPLIHKNWPYLEAEVEYAVKNEYVIRPIDFLTRRVRFAFLDIEATKESVPKVVNLMAPHLGWSNARKNQEIQQCYQDLKEFEYK